MAFIRLLENYVKTPWWQIFQCTYFSEVIFPVKIPIETKMKFLGLKWSENKEKVYELTTSNKNLIERLNFAVSSTQTDLVIPLLIDGEKNRLITISFGTINILGVIPELDSFIKNLRNLGGISEKFPIKIITIPSQDFYGYPEEIANLSYYLMKSNKVNVTKKVFLLQIQAFCSIFQTDFAKERMEMIDTIIGSKKHSLKYATARVEKKISRDVYKNNITNFLQENQDFNAEKQKMTVMKGRYPVELTYKYGINHSFNDEPAIKAKIDGKNEIKIWYTKGKIGRKEGPSIVIPGYNIWYSDGKIDEVEKLEDIQGNNARAIAEISANILRDFGLIKIVQEAITGKKP